MRLKHLSIRHDGMVTIVPDAVRISTQEAGEELVSAGEVRSWSTNYTYITRASGEQITLKKVTEIVSLFSREQE